MTCNLHTLKKFKAITKLFKVGTDSATKIIDIFNLIFAVSNEDTYYSHLLFPPYTIFHLISYYKTLSVQDYLQLLNKTLLKCSTKLTES